MNKLIAFMIGKEKLEECPIPSMLTAEEQDKQKGREAIRAMLGAETPPVWVNPAQKTTPKVMPGKCKHRQVQTGDFIWETDDGERMHPRDMATAHLFYTIRMIYNHSAPPFMRVGDYKYRHGVRDWPVEYRQQATNALIEEFDTRKDATPEMKRQIEDMLLNSEFAVMMATATLPPETTESDPAGSPSPAPEDVRDAYVNAAYEPEVLNPETMELLRKSILAGGCKHQNRRAAAKSKRMKRAAKTDLRGFPGKRCMEHRSYAGVRLPRIGCNACRQVYRARQRNRKLYE